MLHIQSELRCGKSIPEICEPLGIKYTMKDGKVILTYSMIDSPKIHPIVRECRGLILYTDNWDVASYGFKRFFNYGESGADTLPEDLSSCLVYPKLDGTMCNLYWDRTQGKWCVATRSMMYAEGPVNNLENKSFAELFWKAFENRLSKDSLDDENIPWLKYCTYTFELTSPMNRIVTPYKEANITLLTYRSNTILKEASYVQVFRHAGITGIDCVRQIPMTNWKELLKMQGLEAVDEGYVVVRESNKGSHKRVKVKNPAYLAISRLVSSTSEKAFVELIQQGGEDEYLAYYPEYKSNIQKLIDGISTATNIMRKDYIDIQGIKDRKEFALAALKKKYPSILFAMRDGKITNLDKDLLLLPTERLVSIIHEAIK